MTDTIGSTAGSTALPAPSLPQTGRVARPAPLTRALASLRAVPSIGTYLGVGLATVGLVMLVVAWGRVAGLTNVALQLPYVVSAGFGGLGMVAVGLTVVNVAAKQADARERTRQLAELRDLLAELRSSVTEQDGDVR